MREQPLLCAYTMQNKPSKNTVRKTMNEKIQSYVNSDTDFHLQNMFNITTKNLMVALPEFNDIDIVCAYYPMKYEASCTELITETLKIGKKIALPKIYNNQMSFHLCENLNEENFIKNKYGIFEPTTKALDFSDFRKENPINILVLVPGLAFTKDGLRLGRGKGYYDSFLFNLKYNHTNIKCISVGLCFSFQILQNIPTEEHDQSVNYLLSEKGLVNCRTS